MSEVPNCLQPGFSCGSRRGDPEVTKQRSFCGHFGQEVADKCFAFGEGMCFTLSSGRPPEDDVKTAEGRRYCLKESCVRGDILHPAEMLEVRKEWEVPSYWQAIGRSRAMNRSDVLRVQRH